MTQQQDTSNSYTARETTRVVVVGAGYAGMMAALRLSGKSKKQGVEVLLINGRDAFVYRPRLHELATDQPVPEKPIAHMLRGTPVKFRQGWVTAMDPGRRALSVQTPGGAEEISYDYLVYALGSVVDRDSVPGVREHAFALDPAGTRSAPELRARLLAMKEDSGRIVVVGGGATGIEGATEIKGAFPGLQVSLVTRGSFGDFKGERVQRHLGEAFREQGIGVHEHRTVTAVEDGRLILDGGEAVPFEALLWAGGFRAIPLAGEAGLAVNQKGQILVDPYLRSVSHPEIYGVGDAAHAVEEPGVPLRMSLLTALVRGALAADNLSALIAGKKQKPLSFDYYGQGIALGPKDAVGFAGYPNDNPVGPIIRGKAAVFIRNFFVSLLGQMLELERRRPGFFFWTGKGRYEKAKRAAARRRPSEATV
jgi:NADH dehydrogenase FAD-containing subunit